MNTPPPTWNALSDLDLENRRVLLRVDLQRPRRRLDGDKQNKSEGTGPHLGIWDPKALDSAYPTLHQLLDAGARVVIAAHQQLDAAARAPSLAKVGEMIAEALQCEVHLPDEVVGDGVSKIIRDLRGRQVVLLENLAKDPREAQCSPELGKQLAQLCDLYVSDAPEAASMALASTEICPQHFAPALRGVGERMQRYFEAAHSLQPTSSPHTPTALLFARERADIVTLAALAQLVEGLKSGDLLITGGFLGLALAKMRRDPADFEAAGLERESSKHCNRILSRAAKKGLEVRTPIDLVVGRVDDSRSCYVQDWDLPGNLPHPQDHTSENPSPDTSLSLPPRDSILGLGEMSLAQLSIPPRYDRVLWLGSFNGSFGAWGPSPSSNGQLRDQVGPADQSLAASASLGRSSLACVGEDLSALWSTEPRPAQLHFYRSQACMLRLLARAPSGGLEALCSNEPVNAALDNSSEGDETPRSPDFRR